MILWKFLSGIWVWSNAQKDPPGLIKNCQVTYRLCSYTAFIFIYNQWHKHIDSNCEKISTLLYRIRNMKQKNFHLHSAENYYVTAKLQLLVFRSYCAMNKGLSLQASSSCFLPFYQNNNLAMGTICFNYLGFGFLDQVGQPPPTLNPSVTHFSFLNSTHEQEQRWKEPSWLQCFASHFTPKPRKICHTVHIGFFFSFQPWMITSPTTVL